MDHDHDNNGFGWGRDDAQDDSLSFQFTVTNGTVSGEEVVFGNGHAHSVTLTSADAFTLGTGTVTETVTTSDGTHTILYGLESGSTTLYQVTATSFTLT